MKKVIKSVISAVLAAVTCAGFAACGKNDFNAQEYVSERVSAEEWEAAFSEANFENVKVQVMLTNTVLGVKGQIVAIIDGSKEYQKAYSEEIEENFENYAVTEDSVTTLYLKDENGSWETRTVTKVGGDYYNSNYEWQTGSVVNFSEMYTTVFCQLFKEMYDDFDYSGEAKGYVIKTNVDDGNWYSSFLNHGTIKFQDGKLAAILLANVAASGEETAEIVYTYGGQNISLPEVSE